MNDGLQILIERMETHPEEFDLSSRWNREVESFRVIFNDEDIKAYDSALRDTRQRLFTARIMNTLVSEEREDKEALKKAKAKVSLSSSQYEYLASNNIDEQHRQMLLEAYAEYKNDRSKKGTK